MIENRLRERAAAGRGEEAAAEEGEMRKMAITAIVAMVEIWMSDLWYVPR